MNHSPATNENSAGLGLLGCLGGILLGIAGGGLLLGLASWVIALNQPLPPSPIPPPGAPDLRVVVTEDFLNRYVEPPVEGTVRVDILPQNQVQVQTNSTVEVFGVPAPIQASGLFGLELIGPTTPRINLLSTEVFGLELDMSRAFDRDIATVNQELQNLVNEVAVTLRVPVIIISLSSSDTQFQIDFREAQ